VPVENYVLSPERELDERVLGVGRASPNEPAIAPGLAGISLVVWSMNNWIVGSRIDAEGRLLDPTPILFSPNAGLYPEVAFDGTYWLVAWGLDGIIVDGIDPRVVQAKRVDTSGRVVDDTPIVVATETRSLHSLSRGGDGWLVGWSKCATASCVLYETRVSRDGSVLDPNGIRVTEAPSFSESSSVSYDGRRWLVVWSSNSDVRGARIDAAGTVLDPTGFPIATGGASKWNASAASNGNAWLVAWLEGPANANTATLNLYVARVNADGTLLDTPAVAITTDSSTVYAPQISHDGTNWLVAWSHFGSRSFRATRVDSAGTVLDPGGFVVDPAIYRPQFAFNGENWLFVWRQTTSNSSYDIFALRVGSNTQVLDSSPTQVTTHPNVQRNPAAARGHDDWLVAWEDYRNGRERDIYATRVSATGEALDVPAIPIATGSREQYSPAVAFDGTNWLVVFVEDPTQGRSVYGKRVDRNGTVLDTAPIPIAANGNYHYTPAVSHDGTNWLVVYWREPDYNLWGKRVSPSGSVLDPSGIPISTATSSQRFPDVAYDGTNWLVVWQDYRYSAGLTSVLFGARVTSAGTVLEPNGFQLSGARLAQETRPAVTHNGTDWIVSWADARSNDHFDIFGTRVRPNGTVLDLEGRLIGPGGSASNPSAANVRSKVFVAWEDQGPIYGTWVDENGAARSPPLSISSGSGGNSGVKLVAGARDELLIVYDSPAPYPRIKTRILGPAGGMGGSGGTEGGGGAGGGSGVGVGGAGGVGSAGGVGGAGRGGLGGAGGRGSQGGSGAMSGASSGGSTSGAAGADDGGASTGGSDAGRGSGGDAGASGDDAGASGDDAGASGGDAGASGGDAAGSGDGQSGAGSGADTPDGCGCRVPGSRSRSHDATAWLCVLLIGGLVVRTRRVGVLARAWRSARTCW
jgi:hypothetical protein